MQRNWSIKVLPFLGVKQKVTGECDQTLCEKAPNFVKESPKMEPFQTRFGLI
jgi:hypothetical protein